MGCCGETKIAIIDGASGVDRIKQRNALEALAGIVKTSVPLEVVECEFKGSVCAPPVGKSVSRTYIQCGNGLGVVCLCDCNPNCDGYKADVD